MANGEFRLFMAADYQQYNISYSATSLLATQKNSFDTLAQDLN
jgi:hypothetical protein